MASDMAPACTRQRSGETWLLRYGPGGEQLSVLMFGFGFVAESAWRGSLSQHGVHNYYPDTDFAEISRGDAGCDEIVFDRIGLLTASAGWRVSLVFSSARQADPEPWPCGQCLRDLYRLSAGHLMDGHPAAGVS